MSLGLKKEDLDYLIKTLESFPEIDKAIIFGSRAKGTCKIGSDVDIAIVGDRISFTAVAKLHHLLENESPLPYFFDIVDYTHLEHIELKEHIDRVGKLIYQR